MTSEAVEGRVSDAMWGVTVTLAGLGRDVGRDGHFGMRPERVRLDAEHVQRGMAERACVQRRDERVIVDQGASTRVDDCGIGGQQRQGFGIDDVGRRGRVRQEQDDDIGIVKGVFKPRLAVVAGDVCDVFGPAAPAMDVEMEGGQLLRAGCSKRAHAKHANLAVAGQWRRAFQPCAALAVDVAVHAEMVAQGVAGDPFDHAFTALVLV